LSVAIKDIPEREAHFLQRYRAGDISTEEKIELFEFLNSLRDIPGFTLKALCTEAAFNEFDYKRLNTEWYRFRKQQEKRATESATEGPPSVSAQKTVAEKTAQISKGATDALLGEVKEIGAQLVASYAKNAAERGEKLSDYVFKSIEFREKYGDQIEALIQQNDVLKALCSMFVEIVKPHFRQLAATRIYLDWVTGLLQLEAMGIEVDPIYIENVTTRLEQALNIQLT